MEWICPECRSRNSDSSANCLECGYENKSLNNQPAYADESKEESMLAQQNTKHGKWIIVCPTCGSEIIVYDEHSEIEVCPHCGSDSVETQNAFFREEVRIVRKTETEKRTPRLFIREIEAAPVVSNSMIYYQKGRNPVYISDPIEIRPPEMQFGRNDISGAGDYYMTISEKHCRFRLDEDGSWYVSDTKSSNGTRVDKKRLIGENELKLRDECELQLADKLFIVFIE